MSGSGCKNCPVNPCETMNYRGSTCAAQRAKFGLGDPQTNADRIRAMSDEELATSNYIPCPYDDDGYGECKYGWHKREQSCEECKLEWLKQPAE